MDWTATMSHVITVAPELPQDWVRDYLERSGDTEIGDPTVPWEWYQDPHGFITYYTLQGHFWILQAYGDGPYWDAWAINEARERGCSRVVFLTRRNPAAFARKFGYRCIGFLMEKAVETAH